MFGSIDTKISGFLLEYSFEIRFSMKLVKELIFIDLFHTYQN